MKRLKVLVDDDVYRQVRARAERFGLSVSALVRNFLLDLEGQEPDFERRLQLQKKTLATIHSFSAGDRLTRDEVHKRSAR
jgi:plasmid stability protein